MKPAPMLLVLAGCAAPAPLPLESVSIDIPADLRTCPTMPAAVPEPPKPRTFDAVIAWARLTEARRAETAHALEVCRARLVKLTELAEQMRR